MKIDLVILNQRQAGYNQELRDQIHRLLAQMHSEIWLNQRGGIFILNAGQLNEADRILLETAARVVLGCRLQGPASTAQLDALRRQPGATAALCARTAIRWRRTKALCRRWPALPGWPSTMGWADSARTAAST